nr:plasmid partitioning protein [uncultured Pseudomonas sp.]
MFTAKRDVRWLGLFALLACLFATPSWADSPCSERTKTWFVPGKIACSHKTTWIPSGALSVRKVIYETPAGTPPAGGWPVVLIYQGSFFALDDFVYYSNEWLGKLYNEGKTIKTLLEHGYAVIAPSAPADLFWQTNIPGLSGALYPTSTDFAFLTNLFKAIDDGHFGPLNGKRKYATGISSGGYNTSRMAVSFPGQFKALVVHSGSYASCSGPLCLVPSELPANHPPTFFIHGYSDLIVPWWTMDLYYDRLLQKGIRTGRYTEFWGGHEWFDASPGKVLAWFNANP